VNDTPLPRDAQAAPSVIDLILALEQAGREAFLARDGARLDGLWSDALQVNSPINRVNGKAQVLALLQAGVIAHSALEATVELIEAHGDVVVVMGSERVVDDPAQPARTRRYTNVWRREGEAWRLFVRHANLMAPAPARNPTR
jgi:hypothetical protein